MLGTPHGVAWDDGHAQGDERHLDLLASAVGGAKEAPLDVPRVEEFDLLEIELAAQGFDLLCAEPAYPVII